MAHVYFAVRGSKALPRNETRTRFKTVPQIYGSLDKNFAFGGLTIACGLMMIINIAEVLKIHEISASNHANLIVLAPSLVVLMIWVLIMLPWGLRNIIPAQKDGKFVARFGLCITPILAILICQCIYLPLYAIAGSRRLIWVDKFSNEQDFVVPLVVFSTFFYGSPKLDPGLSTQLFCTKQTSYGRAEVGCEATNLIGVWDYGVSVNYTSPLTLKLGEYIWINARITAKNMNLDAGNGIIPLHYTFIDPVFTNNISVAFHNNRYPLYTSYPWQTTGFVIASLNQITMDDAANSLKSTDHKDYSQHNIYDVFSAPDFPANITSCSGNVKAPCFRNATLQISHTSQISNIRTSQPEIGPVQMLLDEGAILGGVSFVTYFLGLYAV